MENLLQILSQLNVVQLLAVAIFIWFFNSRMESRIDKKLDELANRIEKLDEKITDIDRRLCRLEGAFTSKECCMIKDERHLKKTE